MIDKSILIEYRDACELVKETDQRIKRLRAVSESAAVDVVKGSNPVFPYQPVTFHIEGIEYGKYKDPAEIQQLEDSLKKQVAIARQKQNEMEDWLGTCPSRIQRIVHFRYIDGLSWDEVGRRCGNFTGDAVRKELSRFMENDDSVKNAENQSNPSKTQDIS